MTGVRRWRRQWALDALRPETNWKDTRYIFADLDYVRWSDCLVNAIWGLVCFVGLKDWALDQAEAKLREISEVEIDTTREKTKESGKGREIPEELEENRIQNIIHGDHNDK